jgi:hypothetical protein
MERLRRFNAVMAVLHTVQGTAVLALSNSFSLPVSSSFLRLDGQGGLSPDPKTLFEVEIAVLVAAFLFISAAAHAVVATVGYTAYRRYLERGQNPFRWIEYAASSSVMIVVIAMLVGIYDVAALLPLFAANASMILFGWVMETRNEGRERVDWMPFWFGTFAGVIPWVAVGIYLFGAPSPPPAFVYWIYGSIFLFFNVFAVNMALQYRRVGRWSDYLYGERAYIVLSLVAKSLLAWQVFAGTLRPA